MDSPLQDDTILTLEQIADVARRLREESGDKQEETAEKIDVDQAAISKAENGAKRYVSVCISMIEEYSDCTVESPLYRITRREE